MTIVNCMINDKLIIIWGGQIIKLKSKQKQLNHKISLKKVCDKLR